jgi:hypothetical protein
MRPLASLMQPEPVLWLSLVNAALCTVLPVFATMMAVARIGAGPVSLAGMIGPVSTIALATYFSASRFGWQLAGTVPCWPACRSVRKAGAISSNRNS